MVFNTIEKYQIDNFIVLYSMLKKELSMSICYSDQ